MQMYFVITILENGQLHEPLVYDNGVAASRQLTSIVDDFKLGNVENTDIYRNDLMEVRMWIVPMYSH